MGDVSVHTKVDLWVSLSSSSPKKPLNQLKMMVRLRHKSLENKIGIKPLEKVAAGLT